MMAGKLQRLSFVVFAATLCLLVTCQAPPSATHDVLVDDIAAEAVTHHPRHHFSSKRPCTVFVNNMSLAQYIPLLIQETLPNTVTCYDQQGTDMHFSDLYKSHTKPPGMKNDMAVSVRLMPKTSESWIIHSRSSCVACLRQPLQLILSSVQKSISWAEKALHHVFNIQQEHWTMRLPLWLFQTGCPVLDCTPFLLSELPGNTRSHTTKPWLELTEKHDNNGDSADDIAEVDLPPISADHYNAFNYPYKDGGKPSLEMSETLWKFPQWSSNIFFKQQASSDHTVCDCTCSCPEAVTAETQNNGEEPATRSQLEDQPDYSSSFSVNTQLNESTGPVASSANHVNEGLGLWDEGTVPSSDEPALSKQSSAPPKIPYQSAGSNAAGPDCSTTVTIDSSLPCSRNFADGYPTISLTVDRTYRAEEDLPLPGAQQEACHNHAISLQALAQAVFMSGKQIMVSKRTFISQVSALTHLVAMLPVIMAVHVLPGLQQYPPCGSMLAWCSSVALVLMCWLVRAMRRGRELWLEVQGLQGAMTSLKEERDNLREALRCESAAHAQDMIAWQATVAKNSEDYSDEHKYLLRSLEEEKRKHELIIQQIHADHEKEMSDVKSGHKKLQDVASTHQEKLRVQLDSMRRQLKQVLSRLHQSKQRSATGIKGHDHVVDDTIRQAVVTAGVSTPQKNRLTTSCTATDTSFPSSAKSHVSNIFGVPALNQITLQSQSSPSGLMASQQRPALLSADDEVASTLHSREANISCSSSSAAEFLSPTCSSSQLPGTPGSGNALQEVVVICQLMYEQLQVLTSNLHLGAQKYTISTCPAITSLPCGQECTEPMVDVQNLVSQLGIRTAGISNISEGLEGQEGLVMIQSSQHKQVMSKLEGIKQAVTQAEAAGTESCAITRAKMDAASQANITVQDAAFKEQQSSLEQLLETKIAAISRQLSDENKTLLIALQTPSSQLLQNIEKKNGAIEAAQTELLELQNSLRRLEQRLREQRLAARQYKAYVQQAFQEVLFSMKGRFKMFVDLATQHASSHRAEVTTLDKLLQEARAQLESKQFIIESQEDEIRGYIQDLEQFTQCLTTADGLLDSRDEQIRNLRELLDRLQGRLQAAEDREGELECKVQTLEARLLACSGSSQAGCSGVQPSDVELSDALGRGAANVLTVVQGCQHNNSPDTSAGLESAAQDLQDARSLEVVQASSSNSSTRPRCPVADCIAAESVEFGSTASLQKGLMCIRPAADDGVDEVLSFSADDDDGVDEDLSFSAANDDGVDEVLSFSAGEYSPLALPVQPDLIVNIVVSDSGLIRCFIACDSSSTSVQSFLLTGSEEGSLVFSCAPLLKQAACYCASTAPSSTRGEETVSIFPWPMQPLVMNPTTTMATEHGIFYDKLLYCRRNSPLSVLPEADDEDDDEDTSSDTSDDPTCCLAFQSDSLLVADAASGVLPLIYLSAQISWLKSPMMVAPTSTSALEEHDNGAVESRPRRPLMPVLNETAWEKLSESVSVTKCPSDSNLRKETVEPEDSAILDDCFLPMPPSGIIDKG
ncbi:hypothetical protein CEUSTIGMA_g13646.t1 [Chlamydomonas eustigma]|uniref:Uncharacterized protein n=1 Tax=Chlamydomonas eustigma TaxID=1157962 RepID=A0A250XT94_9CHLO|nr:hypothetical protein CEUSTIGMA_g13646.t1 [Chlamydomonas eustigma]|eukprot:GAX86233.1 hypothetical protein CEUSTIGMA_g13646.t1 [Chlamydomonas eustigma]